MTEGRRERSNEVLIVDVVRYVLYVETPLAVGNASITRRMFYNKYASERISTVVTLVASSGYR
jgi:hypothetical protein